MRKGCVQGEYIARPDLTARKLPWAPSSPWGGPRGTAEQAMVQRAEASDHDVGDYGTTIVAQGRES